MLFFELIVASQFSRSFRLPPNVDATKLRASCADGVTKVILPKKTPAPEQTGTKIPVADSHQ